MKLPLEVIWEIALWSPSASYLLAQTIKDFGEETLTKWGKKRLRQAFIRIVTDDTGRGIFTYKVLPNGNIDGYLTERDYNGTIVYQCEYVNNIQIGRMYRVREDGSIRVTDWAKNFRTDGVSTVYSPDGTVLERRCCSNGNLSGPLITYHPDGVARTCAVYVNGVIDGLYIEWHPNGRPSLEAEYQRGRPIGTWRTWDQAGNLVTYKVHDETGHRFTSYHSNGKPDQDYYVGLHGRDGASFGWYSNGARRYICEYFRNDRHGILYSYYSNEQLAEKTQYVNGKKAGMHLCWYPNGVLKKKCGYRVVKHGDYYSAWPNGKTKRIATFATGVLVGKEYLFDEDGNKFAIVDHSKTIPTSKLPKEDENQ